MLNIDLLDDPTPRYVPKGNENMCLHKNLYINIHVALLIIAKSANNELIIN